METSNLGILIKTEIKRQKRTQKEVSEKVGISETALSQIVKGIYYPSRETLTKLCEVLDVTLVYSFNKN